jgi:phage portal protein BeeE
MHKIPVLEEGAEMHQIGQSMDDMQFAEMAEQTRAEIAVLFNIPPAFLAAKSGDSLTYATQLSNDIQFHRLAVLPLAGEIADTLSIDASLLPWNVMYAEFVYDAILRADPMTQAEYWEKLQKILRLRPEYIAARMNIPQDAIGPEPVAPPMVQADMAPASPSSQLRALNP